MSAPRAFTLPLPVTADYPVPTSIVVEMRADGSATARARIDELTRGCMWSALWHRFGKRAGWPREAGREWVAEIAPLEVEDGREVPLSAVFEKIQPGD